MVDMLTLIHGRNCVNNGLAKHDSGISSHSRPHRDTPRGKESAIGEKGSTVCCKSWACCFGNGSGDTAIVLQALVGSINNGLHMLLDQIAMHHLRIRITLIQITTVMIITLSCTG